MKLSRTIELDPAFVYKKYANISSKIKIGNLVIIKRQDDTIENIINNDLNENIFTYNVFRINKSKLIRRKVERT